MKVDLVSYQGGDVIRASRAAYLVCGVLTALALAGWGVRAAGAPQNNTANNASNATVPLAAPNQAAGAAGGAVEGNAPQAGGEAAAANENAAPNAAPPVSAVGNKTTTLSAKSLPRMGQVVVDDKGWVLYRFDKDTPNPPASNCKDKCAQIWPPVLSNDGNIPQLEGIDSSLVGTIDRADGGKQVTIGGWALYRYIGDKTPGKWTGQGVGATWFVVSPNGKKNLTCLPTGTPKAVEPPAAGDAGSNSGGGSGY
jgi:predicted lipoprotein with Yx(FWY)xxD motif